MFSEKYKNDTKWKSTKISIYRTIEGYLAKGMLTVSNTYNFQTYYIPYGGSATEIQVAIEKAQSEMVERVVWYEVLLLLTQQNNKVFQSFSTVGWAAHKSLMNASNKSAWEFIERKLLNIIIDLLSSKKINDNWILTCANIINEDILEKWIPNQHFSIMIPIFIKKEKVYIVLIFISCAINSTSDNRLGIIIGMGHSLSLSEAIYNAKCETLLVYNALANYVNNSVNIQKNNLANKDTKLFWGYFTNNQIYINLQQIYISLLTISNKSTINIFEMDSGSCYKTIDFTEIQPSWLRNLSRFVCFTDACDSDIHTPLQEVLDRFIYDT